jgi:hypothetical protein
MEQQPWTRTIGALVLLVATSLVCYSLGWQRGNVGSTSKYHRRLDDINRVVQARRDSCRSWREEGGHAGVTD